MAKIDPSDLERLCRQVRALGTAARGWSKFRGSPISRAKVEPLLDKVVPEETLLEKIQKADLDRLDQEQVRMMSSPPVPRTTMAAPDALSAGQENIRVPDYIRIEDHDYLAHSPAGPRTMERSPMPRDLPKRSEIRRLIQIDQPPGMEHDRAVVLCFMPFYLVPPAFSTDDAAACLLVIHMQQEHGVDIQVVEDPCEPARFKATSPGSSLCLQGVSRAHATTNFALWWCALYQCENDEGG